MRSAALLTGMLLLFASLAGCLGGDDAPEDAGDNDVNATATGGPDEAAPDATAPEEGNETTTAAPEVAPVEIQVRVTGLYPLTAAYDPASLSVPAGADVTVVFENADQNPVAPHDWVVEGVDGAKTDVIDPGQTTQVAFTAPAEPGEYAFFCSVGDHREHGLEGTFTVE